MRLNDLIALRSERSSSESPTGGPLHFPRVLP